MLLCFGIFIVCCGLTHLMDVWNAWNTDYWLEGLIKVMTAAASVPTAIMLWRALPAILSVPSSGIPRTSAHSTRGHSARGADGCIARR